MDYVYRLNCLHPLISPALRSPISLFNQKGGSVKVEDKADYGSFLRCLIPVAKGKGAINLGVLARTNTRLIPGLSLTQW
jgi:hypothetical protein